MKISKKIHNKVLERIKNEAELSMIPDIKLYYLEETTKALDKLDERIRRLEK